VSSWDESEAAKRLRAAGAVAVGDPPPLAGVREIAARRARRNTKLLAFAVALPIGAFAAMGTRYAWKDLPLPRRGPSDSAALRSKGQGEGAVRVTKNLEKPKQEQAVVEPTEAIAPVAPAFPVPSALPPRAPKPLARAAPSRTPLTPPEQSGVESKGLSPTGEREESLARTASSPAPLSTAASTTPEIPAISGYAPPPPPARTALADEAATLSEALAALRTRHDPTHALELLATYRSRFPAGTLRREAALATVEAHRTLGHSAEALAALDELPRRPELAVLRAELNAELGHCDAAREALRGVAATGPLKERALYTDASCAVVLGAREEAMAELQQLPDSARARALLEKLSP
jgi:hypothetical protein